MERRGFIGAVLAAVTFGLVRKAEPAPESDFPVRWFRSQPRSQSLINAFGISNLARISTENATEKANILLFMHDGDIGLTISNRWRCDGKEFHYERTEFISKDGTSCRSKKLFFTENDFNALLAAAPIIAPYIEGMSFIPPYADFCAEAKGVIDVHDKQFVEEMNRLERAHGY